jgi:hypothetical protein
MANIELKRMHSLAAWLGAPPSACPVELGPNFEYDAGFGTMNAEEWMRWRRVAAPYEAVDMILVVGTQDVGVAIFSATDPVTGLRHRIALVAEWSTDKLDRIIQTTGNVPIDA